MSAPRSRKRRDWPRGLYEIRAGYFVWSHPETGKRYPIGRVPLLHAIDEARAANAKVLGDRPSLVDRIAGADHTVADLLGQMPAAKAANTAKSQRAHDKVIRQALGEIAAGKLTTKHCARPIEAAIAAGKLRNAQALRSRLIAVCRRGMQLGWMAGNPAEATASPRVEVQRARLTLDQFMTILARAPEVAEWLPKVMLLMLVTLQDRDTIAKMRFSDVVDDCLLAHRAKTAAKARPVAIPLGLNLRVVPGASLRDLVARRGGILSPFIVHHVKPWGNAPTGAPVAVDRMSHAFAEARDLAGFGGGENPPTLYECKSLGVRTYRATQPEVDTKALAGHMTDRMAELYADGRGIEPVQVRIA